MTDRSAAAPWLDRVRQVWNERAERWDEMSDRNAVGSDRAADRDRAWRALRLHPGARLLDAGCGSGQFAVAFAERGCRVTAIDLAPNMIGRARALGLRRGVEVDWRVGDLSRLADPLAVYDAVHARVALQFVPDVAAALREFRRVLRPSGRLLASVPGALSPIYQQSWRRHLDPAAPTANFLLPWELESLLEALGWRLIDGWGEHGGDLAGTENPFSPAVVAPLDRRLRQAAATTWTVIAA